MEINQEHTLNQGRVVLTLLEFQAMIDRLKPTVQAPEEKTAF